MIPYHLIEQIKAGNAVLFLGAGASRGARDDQGREIPDGRELSKMIASKFLGPDYENQTDLSYISDLSIAASSLFEVQNFIADKFTEFQPQPHHLLIPQFKWKAIYTTNYDLIIERSYAAAKPFQKLVPIIKNTPKTQIFKTEDVLPYYKIHGCITDINDPQAPLILTIDQFINHRSKRNRLYQDLEDLSNDYPIIFVGFGMADYDIRSILQKLDADVPQRVKCYMVGPGVTPMETQMWEQRKVTAIKMTFDEFLSELNSKIDANHRVLASIAPKISTPIEIKFNIPFSELKPSTEFLNFLENEIDFVHQNMSTPNTEPKSFYKGYFENWDPIIKNLDITRKLQDGILTEIFIDETKHSSANQYLYVIKGNAGSGKSVLLKRIAFEAGNTLERLSIFLKPSAVLRADHLTQLYAYSKERIYLFIDNASNSRDEIIYLLSKCKKEKVPLTIISAERHNVWNTECHDLSRYLTQFYKIEYLIDREIDDLLRKLEEYDSLGSLKEATYEERVRSFSQRAGKELLVALYEATNGSKPFRDIILDEYRSINSAKAQSLYLTTSIFHRLGTEARAGLISRLHKISFKNFKEELFFPLEEIVFDQRNYRINDYVYITRNRYIAEIIFEGVLLSEQDRYDEYIRILNNINIDYSSDKMAFRSITSAQGLLKVFSDPQKIRSIYAAAQEASYRDPILYQQMAIFEMKSPGGSIVKASKLLDEAKEMDGSENVISHTEAELYLRKAENSKFDNELYTNLERCIGICNRLIRANIKDRRPSAHPYHTILKAHILRFKHVLDTNDPPAVERSIKDIEKLFVEVKQTFPNEEFILESESSFNELINRTENARKLLFHAFNSNMASPFIALRLAGFLEREGDIKAALDVLSKALEKVSNDYELNYKYGLLLQESQNSNFELVEYHLRRGFTMGDTRYQAQYWYARAVYINGNIPKAKEIFSQLSKVTVSPDIKRYTRGLIWDSGVPKVFEGVIKTVSTSSAFIARDRFSDYIFVYRYDSDGNNNLIWDLLSEKPRVRFNICFTYYGPQAIGVVIV